MLGILIVTGFVVVACGGTGSDPSATPAQTQETGDPESGATTTTPGGSAPLGDPCSYVSDAEMSQLLEMEVAGETAGSVITCDYLPVDSDDLVAGGVNMVIEDVTDGGCEPVFNVAGYGSTGGEPVDGVGTYAKYGDDFVQQLAVCFNDEVTLIATLGIDTPDPKATLVAIAEAFEANLP
jgi:hypothetical protein